MESENGAYIDDTYAVKGEEVASEDVLDGAEDSEVVKGDENDSQEVDSTPEESSEGSGEVPIFEREDWADKVNEFEKRYPVARDLLVEIGDEILEETNLWNDEMCLEKALLSVLDRTYQSDEVRSSDEEFLENYIYNNEAIRTRIVDEYLESLDRHRLPSTINRGGRISLTAPTKPRSISEAGKLAEKMMRR